MFLKANVVKENHNLFSPIKTKSIYVSARLNRTSTKHQHRKQQN